MSSHRWLSPESRGGRGGCRNPEPDDVRHPGTEHETGTPGAKPAAPPGVPVSPAWSVSCPGKPDIVLPRYRAVVFVHGCFWHGHDCPLFRLPGTRTEFWKDKIGRNRANDQKARDALLAAGWRVAVVWECALRGSGVDLDIVAQRLAGWLHNGEEEIEIRK